MLWSDFGPYVLPHVIGAPEPLLQFHARLAAIEFCRRTLCHTRTLEAVTTDGTAVVELVPDIGTQILKIKSATVGGRPWSVVKPEVGLSHVRTQSPQEFAFTQDNVTLQVYPVQLAGVEVVIEAALCPTLTAASLDDIIAAQYAQDIAHKVVAAIKGIKGQPYTDPEGARDALAAFNGRASTVAAKIARGTANAPMPSHIGFC